MTEFATGPVSGQVELAADPVARFFLPAPMDDRPEVTSPESAAELLAPLLFGMDREACVAVYVDTKHRSLGVETISIGSVDHTFMTPRDIFRGALLVNASAFVLAHNHPSGDPEPSMDDRTVTRRIAKAAELIGIEMLDHLVFGGAAWISMARRGPLD